MARVARGGADPWMDAAPAPTADQTYDALMHLVRVTSPNGGGSMRTEPAGVSNSGDASVAARTPAAAARRERGSYVRRTPRQKRQEAQIWHSGGGMAASGSFIPSHLATNQNGTDGSDTVWEQLSMLDAVVEDEQQPDWGSERLQLRSRLRHLAEELRQEQARRGREVGALERQLAAAEAEKAQLLRALEQSHAAADGAVRLVQEERETKSETMHAVWEESTRIHRADGNREAEQLQLAEQRAEAALRRQLELEQLLGCVPVACTLHIYHTKYTIRKYGYVVHAVRTAAPRGLWSCRATQEEAAIMLHKLREAELEAETEHQRRLKVSRLTTNR